jgi:hypothetical protein
MIIEIVKKYWNDRPCNIKHSQKPVGTKEYFDEVEYRKYFVDRTQNVVLRLSQDGITEISSYGMLDFFRDKLGNVGATGKVVGGWDIHNKQYVVSLQPVSQSTNNEGTPLEPFTLAFDEESLGWVSFYSYIPDYMGGLLNNYYSFYRGGIWIHYNSNVIRGNFYSTQYNTEVKFVFNAQPSLIKNFSTINYEGSTGWRLDNITTDMDQSISIAPASSANNQTLAGIEFALFSNNFKAKENKYFANIFNNSTAMGGDIIWGQSMSGVKGIYAVCSFSLDNAANNSQRELYASSVEYVDSSY